MDGCDDCTGRIQRPVKLHPRINMGHHDRLVCNETNVCVSSLRFPLLFFFQPTIVDFVNYEQYICALFTVLQITLFSNFFIKNGSHNTIYTFENYFATVFSVSVFNFSKNKFNPNTPSILSKRVKMDKAKQSDCKVQSYK